MKQPELIRSSSDVGRDASAAAAELALRDLPERLEWESDDHSGV